MLVTANNTGTGALTVTRGQDGTSGQAFAANATLTPALSAKMINDAMARLDVTSAQTLLGPIKIPPSVGGTVAPTFYASVGIKIAETALVATAASVSFSSIPANFRHLREWWAGSDNSGNSADNLNLALNGDGGTNYDEAILTATTSVSVVQAVGQTAMRIGIMQGGSGTNGNGGFITIVDYTATGRRRSIQAQCFRNDSALGMEIDIGAWRNTAAAVNQTTLAPAAGSFIVGDVFTLEGIS